MDLSDFRVSLQQERPPRGLAAPLLALWHEARGEWAKAHEIVQEGSGKDAARVHAYLHRKEGDTSNARYWYTRAGIEPSLLPLEREWERLVRDLLNAA